MKQKDVKDSLLAQLAAQNKSIPYYQDMVEDYMRYWSIKRQLADDIKSRGAVVEVTSGNGFCSTKCNESIAMLHKTTATMLKILADLGLQEPVSIDDSDGSDYL